MYTHASKAMAYGGEKPKDPIKMGGFWALNINDDNNKKHCLIYIDSDDHDVDASDWLLCIRLLACLFKT
jgi:predicted lactoylglutathione lyase